MPDQPFAAKLRKRIVEQETWGTVEFSYAEAEAIADALEALAEFMDNGMPRFTEQSWYDEEGVEGTEIMVYGHGWEDRFLDRLNGREAK